MNMFPAGICNDKWRVIPRQPDGEIFYLHFTGGLRAAKVDDDHWFIEPVLENSEVRSKGFLSRHGLEKLITLTGLKAIGFQSAGWSNGVWYSFWRPIVPSRRNNFVSPSNTWGNISKNLAPADRLKNLNNLRELNNTRISEVVDDRSMTESFTQSISLSLRSMDLAIEQITEHYHEQLVNYLYSNRIDGQQSSNTLDQNLFAQVHSFFMQLGSARDYLAALIAHRLGMDASHGKVDTINSLKNKIRTHHVGSDALLDLLIDENWFVKIPEDKDRWTTSGWLKQVTELRNQLIHRRPYGSRYSERFGWVAPTEGNIGLRKYTRPIVLAENEEHDLLDVVLHHYQVCNKFFLDAAKVSNLNASMMHFTDKDIRSPGISIKSRKNQ